MTPSHGLDARRVAAHRDASRAVADVPGLARKPHRMGHRDRILRVGDAGVEQHAVGAEFHRHRDVARRADARIDDDRIVRVAAEAGSLRSSRQMRDRRGIRARRGRIRSGCPRASRSRRRRREPRGRDRIVARVAEHREAVRDEFVRHASSVPIGSGRSVLRSPRTSSFTQSLPGFPSCSSSSRPSRETRTASSALKQPAVLGRIVKRSVSR